MPSPILAAIEQICQEKKLSKEQVLGAIEQALAAAYRKDFGQKNQNIKVQFNPETGAMRVFDVKTVVPDLPPEELSPASSAEDEEKENEEKSETPCLPTGRKNKKSKMEKKTEEKKENEIETEVPEGEEKKRFNPKTEIQLSEAKKIKKSYKIGDIIETELEIPADFGRIAAQTAKQVIVQRLREAERETIFEKYKAEEGKVLNGVIQRQEGRIILVDLGDSTAVMPQVEQVQEEKYWPGQKIKLYLAAVNQTPKGPEIIVSRRHPDILKELFKLEIPEIASGQVKIKAIAREAGARSKVAVATKEENIDPIGSCIGQRGVRIQTIISEIGGEKIDIIEYDDEPEKFVANALSPAKVTSLKINKEEKLALAKVKKNQLSLAIGRAGQNVRLAARLTGWRIDVQLEESPAAQATEDKEKEVTEESGEKREEKKKKEKTREEKKERKNKKEPKTKKEEEKEKKEK